MLPEPGITLPASQEISETAFPADSAASKMSVHCPSVQQVQIGRNPGIHNQLTGHYEQMSSNVPIVHA